jgi:AbrB family looped-hinge helix DNA binding protein
MLDMARISVKGQVTIPVAVRKTLGLKEGDKVVFAQKGENIILLNSNRLAFKEFQHDMAGEAERVGWADEQDVVDFCKKIRNELIVHPNQNRRRYISPNT